MNPELRPREHFKRLLESAETAGQRDEAVGHRIHGGLALVHALDEAQLAEARVRELFRGERPRDHADDLDARRQRRVGEHAHEPDGAAAVDDAEPARRARRRQRARGGRGNTGCRSSSGPTRLASASTRRSTKTTQWGLPTDTTVAVTLPPSGSTSGTATVSRSGPVIGIAEERKLAVPISTVTKLTRPSRSWHVHSTTPPFVSTLNVVRPRACPWSHRYLAKMRRPLPDFSASLPSGLKMRSPKSARVDGTFSKMPSEPTPQLRSQTRSMARVSSGRGRSASSMTM